MLDLDLPLAWDRTDAEQPACSLDAVRADFLVHGRLCDEKDGPALALHSDRDILTGATLNGAPELAFRADRLTVDSDYHVIDFDARLLGCGARFDLIDARRQIDVASSL